MKALFAVIFFISICAVAHSQTLNWAFKAGSTGRDLGYKTHTDNAGNVLVSGFFSGTADFDPSAAVFNLTSNGSEDIFVAKYNASGQFQWAFRIGGVDRDHSLSLTTDQNNNVIVTGFFRGSNVDFDPSASVANLSSNGDGGGDPGYGGDIFLAKYNSAGQYQWAFNIGGTLLYDSGVSISSDAAGNIYLGGYFREVVDFNPSAATNTLNSATGTLFIAKYSTTGAYQWAFNTGLGDNDNAPFDLKADNAGNVHIAGFFQGNNIDFDPSPATAFLNSNGGFEAFFAKYNTSGQYVFAHSIGGTGADVARGIEVDNNGNIYLLGDFSGANVDFDPGPGTALLTSNGGADVYLAKYSSTGIYQWAFNFGGTASDIGWKVSTDNSHLYITGGFTGTADMNPTPAVDNLTSNGGNDIFLGKYTLNGEYLCAFSIGGASDDYGFSIRAGGSNTFYLTGSFQGSNVDFDPTPASFNLSSSGGDDVFAAKFTWPDNPQPNGTLTGSTVCAGQQAQLTFNATAGTGPFTIVYNNGVSNVTANNVQSGVPFNITPNPIVTTTYSLVSIKDALRCSETRFVSGITATVTVNVCNLSCNNWLNTPSNPSYVTVGDVDVAGNKLTVEAVFNRTAPLNNNLYYGHLVSKHTGPGNVNYALLPNGCEITTAGSGYVSTFQTCPPDLNKNHHVAMVYDGTALKFYRNGFLLSSQPCTGNMVTNDLATTIAQVSSSGAPFNNQFLGYVNEVRIWNVARTQNEIRNYMNNPLPNPTATPGLVAYYQFNDLLNKQGNTSYNGLLSGTAQVNTTNTQCQFVADSCSIPVNEPPCKFWPVFGATTYTAPIPFSNNVSFTFSNPAHLLANTAYSTMTPGNWFTPDPTVATSSPPNSTPHNPADIGSIGMYPMTVSEQGTINFSSPTTTGFYLHVFQTVSTLDFDHSFTLISSDGDLHVGNSGSLTNNVLIPDVGPFQSPDDANATIYFPAGISQLRFTVTSVPNPAVSLDGIRIAFTFPDNCISVTPCTTKSDFSFSQEACNPFNVYFLTNATGFNSIKWEFGDNNSITALTSLYHLYGLYGNYTVKMIQDYGSCADTVTKTITVNLQNDNQLISTSDTTICRGNTKQLLAAPSLNFCWTPTTYLDNPNISNPVTSTPQNITYFYTAEVTGPNLIANGNFNSGNSLFTSQYNYANPNTTEGQYFIGTSPQSWNASLSPCGDHTTGSGNMMLVNGSPVPDVEVWKQTVAVTPNANYTFSTWIQALWPPNPAQLQFAINGNTVGAVITASLPTCTWTQFHTNWNSGTATSAVISIVNKNTQVQGNDFALDDIAFSAVTFKRDSVKITVTDPQVRSNNDTSFCKGGLVQLNATGANTYSWSPPAGLNNPNIANPVATPLVTTQYIVTGTTTGGCSAKDTVVVTINDGPAVIKSNDTTVCAGSQAQLFASGGVSYSWSPAATLNNPGISNPVAAPSAATTYYVTVTGSNTCTTLDSVRVGLRSPNNFTVDPASGVCQFKPVQLNASGGDLYAWSPAGSLDDAFIANPIATPAATTVYNVLITDTLCNFSSLLSTAVTVFPLPAVKANKTNDLDCIFDRATLIAAGARRYTWTPMTGLTNPGTGTTIAIPDTTTQYVVHGIDANGCENADSIILYVTKNGKSGYLMPTAFTPNGDGLNDCYRIKYWGTFTELEFSIYNRWGERVFFTKNPGDCWDGTYNGVPQGTAVFVYMVKAKTTCEAPVFKKGTFALIR